MRAYRGALTHEALHLAAIEAARHFADFVNAHAPVRSIACYLSYGKELPTGPILDVCRDKGLRVAVPAWDGGLYRFAWLSDGEVLEEGPKGIPQPARLLFADASEFDLFLVPGLVFSTDGGRIGYGGGWYDRLLPGRRPDSFCQGLCLDGQLVADALPLEPHDLRMDAVLAPSGICPCISRPNHVTSSTKGEEP